MGRIKMLFGVFVMVAGVYLSIKVIPPYFENYQFQDAIKDEATHDSYGQKSEEDIRQSVLKKARDFDIPITAEGIQVQRQGYQFSGTVIVHAPYVVHVEIPVYPFDLHFDASTENKGVL